MKEWQKLKKNRKRSLPTPMLWSSAMKGVVDSIKVESIDDRTWRLLENFEWYGIVVPQGFETDFASIPRPFWILINPTGRIKTAALVHDWLYNLRGVLPCPITRNGEIKHTLTRSEVDKEFLDIMKILKMSLFKRYMAYRAVRSFGWLYWNRKAQ